MTFPRRKTAEHCFNGSAHQTFDHCRKTVGNAFNYAVNTNRCGSKAVNRTAPDFSGRVKTPAACHIAWQKDAHRAYPVAVDT